MARAGPAAIIRAVTPLLVGAAGLVALLAGGLILRTFGAAFRIGRLLATAPTVTIAEANAIAAAGRKAYVRVAGRIDAEDEFEDADHRPLVFRRVRLETRRGRSWRPFEDHRKSVPFTVNEGLDSIAVDDRAPEGSSPDTPVRVRIEQVSSVEHAIVVGYPVAIDAGPLTAQLTAGRGRPLILTVLEPPEAMRILAGGDAGRTRLAAGLLGAGMTLIVGAVTWAAVTALLPAIVAIFPGAGGLVTSALAATAEPSVAAGGDPRSNGQGPGLVGTPGLAIVAVVAIALLAILVTTLYVRLTASPREARERALRSRRRGGEAGDRRGR